MTRQELDKLQMALTDSLGVISEFDEAINSNSDSVRDNYYLDNSENINKINAVISLVRKRKDETHDGIEEFEINDLLLLTDQVEENIKECMRKYCESSKKSLNAGFSTPVISEESLKQRYNSDDEVKAMVNSFKTPVAQEKNDLSAVLPKMPTKNPQPVQAKVTQQPFVAPQPKVSHVPGGTGTKIDDLVQAQQAMAAMAPAVNLAMPKALMICFVDGTCMMVMEDRAAILAGKCKGGYTELTEQAAAIINSKPGCNYAMYKLDGTPCTLVPSYSLKF